MTDYERNGPQSAVSSARLEPLCRHIESLTTHKPGQTAGKDIPDSPPQSHLPSSGAGSFPGSDKIRFKKRSADASATSKSSANALYLDVVYHSVPTETPSRSLDTSDEDVTMELG
ncbi:hypothetical protein FGIG_09018 [Fasciola gigantica]|uniref:Uncharacterized protein n=1 Tax=Fasciola gigantica TaxID=46835 RepID=A0A504Z9W6_FASGI|nr:hypothetical protein FGIG_09018 [Fasciola gigantica]